MNQKQLEELKHKRAQLVDEMREINGTAEAADRDLTAEEAQEFERREADFDSISERVERAEKLGVTQPAPAPDVRGAFGAYLLGKATPEQRDILNTTDDSEGGYTVPEEWGELIDPLRESGAVRQLASIITTSGAGTLHFPRVDDEASDPAITPEADDTNAGSLGPRTGTIADSAQTFDEVALDAYKYARITKASVEMTQDALFNVGAFVSQRATFDVGLAAGADYVGGSGSGEPEGLMAGATVGVNANAAAAITMDELIELTYSLIAPYRRNGVFLAHDKTVGAMRQLKTSVTDEYLWQPSLQAGQPDRLLGYPVFSDPNVDTLASGKPVVGFGDVKRAYLIRDVGSVDVKVLDQTYAETDEIGWRVRLRTDGKIVDATAFKTIKTA